MLPEIAAEALHFLSRRDVDQACAISKWLDAIIAQCCEVYPLRPVLEVALNKRENHVTLKVRIENEGVLADRSFNNADEAAHFAASILRHSYVEELELDSIILSPNHWTKLIDAIRGGAVRRIEVAFVDLSALHDDALLVAVRCRGLQSLVVRGSDAPSGFVTDALLRSCAAEGLLRLEFYRNNVIESHRTLDDAVLDFFFRDETVKKGQLLTLKLDGFGVTEMFLSRFFDRTRKSAARPSGRLLIYDAAEQRGLSEYAHYLAPSGMHVMNATYRFPSTDDDFKAYEVAFCQRSSFMSMRFNLVCGSP